MLGNPTYTLLMVKQAAPPSVLKDSLLAVYEMEEPTGTTVIDIHNGNDATRQLASMQQPGKINNCYGFGGIGTGEYVRMPSVCEVVNEFTISMWLYPKFWSYTKGHRMAVCGGYGLGQNNTLGGVALTHHWNGNLYFDIYNGTLRGWVAIPDTSVPINTWTHLVLTYDGTANADAMKAYINGATTIQGAGVSKPLDWGGSHFYYGKSFNRNEYDGLIDQFAIWEKATDLSFAQLLYNAGNGLAYFNW